MRIPITEIEIIPGRRKAVPSHIAELAKSIADVSNHQGSSDKLSPESRAKSFVEDTAEKLGR